MAGIETRAEHTWVDLLKRSMVLDDIAQEIAESGLSAKLPYSSEQDTIPYTVSLEYEEPFASSGGEGCSAADGSAGTGCAMKTAASIRTGSVRLNATTGGSIASSGLRPVTD